MLRRLNAKFRRPDAMLHCPDAKFRRPDAKFRRLNMSPFNSFFVNTDKFVLLRFIFIVNISYVSRLQRAGNYKTQFVE
jgi:hypothetical protein